MIDGVSVQLRDATESSVRVTLASNGDVDLSGAWELYGPRCEYGRTLASAFRGRTTEAGDVEFLMTEPCYWSPAMPFLYELRRIGPSADGVTHSLGLQQLIAHGRNLRLGGERIVLRGAAAASFNDDTAAKAHTAEAAVVLSASDDHSLAAASRFGAMAIVDATNDDVELATLVANLSWQPAAAILLLEREHLEKARNLAGGTRSILLAQRFGSQDQGDAAAVAQNASMVIASLNADERPPAWMATCNRPVVAIRRRTAYVDFEEARAACDLLQAELAPEFDLAGYFVAK